MRQRPLGRFVPGDENHVLRRPRQARDLGGDRFVHDQDGRTVSAVPDLAEMACRAPPAVALTERRRIDARAVVDKARLVEAHGAR
jgi:hypothetical protein